MTGHLPARETAARIRVCAAVVTYNRRELLVECLDALLAQTHPLQRLYVVDNASTDGTADVLRERGLLDDGAGVPRAPRAQYGGAGASRWPSTAAARANATGSGSWTTTLRPRPRASGAAGLAAADDPAVAALAQKVVSTDGCLQLGARGHFRGRPRPLSAEVYGDSALPDLGFATLVGVLVRAEIARATAPPRPEFFIWGDDYE